MALIRGEDGKFKKASNASDEQVQTAYQDTIAQLKQINELKARGQEIDEAQRQYLVKILENYRKETNLRKEAKSLVEDQVDGLNDVLASAEKILQKGKQTQEITDKTAKLFETMSGLSGEIAVKLEKQAFSTKEGAAAARETVKQMEGFASVSQKAFADFRKNKIDAKELADIIGDNVESMRDFYEAIDDSTEEGKALKESFKGTLDSVEALNKSLEKGKKTLEGLHNALDQIGKSDIPLVGELAEVAKGGKGAKMALIALGAAAGKLAYDYFGAEHKAGLKAAMDVKEAKEEGEHDVAKMEFDRQFTGKKIARERAKAEIENANEVARLQKEAAYSSEKAAISFAAQMKEGAAQFQAAAKTAYFGRGIGSVAYSAAQMQLAGIGAENIAEQLSAASQAMGTNITSKMASDMAVFAKRTGQSADAIAGVSETFMRLDNVSADTALNMQEGLYALADQAKVDLGGMMKDIADASKDALSYQIKSGPALARQVTYAKSLGVTFGEIAKAGQGMVLNYKDSIKSEMQLSALLGKQVNLGEVRQKFAQGDTEGALKALQAQGLDPSKMNMFQQQALQQATGMDLNSLQKIATKTGRTGELGAGNAAAGNKGFLKATQSAQSNLAAAQAKISADTAVLDSKLSQKIADAYLKSPAYTKYQNALITEEINTRKLATDMEVAYKQSPLYIKKLADEAKLAIERTFKENWGSTIATTAGGILGNVIANKLTDKVFGKVGTSLLGKFAPKLASKVGLASSQFAGGSFSAGKALLAERAAAPAATAAEGLAAKTAVAGESVVAKGGFNLLKSGGNLLKSAGPGLIAAGLGMAGDYFGSKREAEGMAEVDRSKVNQGKAMKAAGTAAEWAGTGMMLGSFAGPMGTVVGGALGGVVGGIKGIWDNWFSEDAEKQDAALKEAEEQKKKQEEQQAAAQQMVDEQGKLRGELIQAGQDEAFFRTTMVAMMEEVARLLDIIAFASDDADDATKEIYLDGKKVTHQLYNKAAMLYAANSQQQPTK